MQHEYVLRDEFDRVEPRRFTLSASGSLGIDGPGLPLKVLRRDVSGFVTLLWGDRIVTGTVRSSGDRKERLEISLDGESFSLLLRDAAVDAMEQAMGSGGAGSGKLEITSPIPGLVKAIKVNAGEAVTAGQTLVVLEAMKMENEISAPANGTVQAVSASAGQTVAAGAPLVTLEK
ncbi:MAG TPA: acetyl-CoA carboxylase biotin carboxyl carrier protein subunit [Planctomycetota bacterium]|nr:acetyl-CoA carboxylase biotin carboxyl carrier protein subunit [Planctomycetota bacterium]